MLTLIRINEEKKWDEVVRSFRTYDVHYLSGYVKAFQLHGDGEPLLLYYDGHNTRGMNVVMKRDIAEAGPFQGKLPPNLWFDLSTPYGYGGFWVEGEDYQGVNEAYSSFCRENGYVSEFVRFNLFSGFHSSFSGEITSYSHNIVRTLDLPSEEILMDFEHKVRTNLQRADDAGLTMEIDSTGKRVEDFLQLYYLTMERTCADRYYFFPRTFFETLNTLNGNHAYLHVLYKETVIASMLVLYGTENGYPFLCGSNSLYFDARPNDFLQFEMIKWAKSKNLKKLVLGGGYGEDDGIYRYKRSFAPRGVHDYYVGMRIFDEDKYKKLVEIRREDASFDGSSRFFPLYRA